MDGRDIGSVVFPEAELKIFLQADLVTRIQRRLSDLEQKHIQATIHEVKQNLRHRDHLDTNRKHSPLIKASDAVSA